jgi:hypothetical protein
MSRNFDEKDGLQAILGLVNRIVPQQKAVFT